MGTPSSVAAEVRDPAPAATRRPAAPRAEGGMRHGVWLWPALLTLALTLYEIDHPLLWEDELNTWDMVTRSTGRLLDTVGNVDAVLTVYYLLLHGWTVVFGDSATALRMPSALAMTGAAACTALIGQQLFGRRAGLAAGLLFALTPVVVRYAHEARPYALVVLAVALATLALLRALDRPERMGRWAAYAGCVAAVGLLHLVALTALAGQLVVVAAWARVDRALAVRAGLAALAGVAAAAPVAVLGSGQASRQIAWIPRPNLESLAAFLPQLYASGTFAGAATVLAVSAWADRRRVGRAGTSPPTSAVSWRPASRGPVLAVTAMAVLPVLALWTVSHGDISYFFYRYLLFTLPAWAVLAGAALAALRSRAVLAVALVAVAVLSLPEQRSVRETYAHFWHGVDYKGAAETIAKYHRPGDAVVYDRGEDYWRLLDLGVRHYLPDELRPRDVFLARSAADRADLWSSECPDPAACLGSETRIWLVVPDGAADPLDALPAPQARALRKHYTATGTERLTGVTVALLVRKP
ncbi:glycosyltransferase family 39 protein [Streptomyces sp. NPDC059567]|uniref:glycosyltransferase family 39 protein n=1 Tax=Streptomyces sp. NPDC059567 TaxID=3346867 RepID=UPI0036AFE118